MPAQSSIDQIKSDLDQLMKKKDITEQLIAVYREQAVFNEKLILPDGFPRNDLDLVAVRTARNKHACLQNDHVALMKEIEQKLELFHHTKMMSKASTKFSDIKAPPSTPPFVSVDHVKVSSFRLKVLFHDFYTYGT